VIAGGTCCALMAAALCCGCAIAPRGDEIFRVDKPVLSADRARYVDSDPDGEFPVVTKDQVLAAWGKPDAIEPPQFIEDRTAGESGGPEKEGVRVRGMLLWGIADNRTPTRNERWIYKDGRRWKGTWFWITIVPIPLLYPTTNQMAVEYSGESVVAIETVNTEHGATTLCFPTLYYFIPVCGSVGQRESNKARFVSARQLLPPNPRLGVAATLAGMAGTSGSTDGIGAEARFKAPAGLAVDGAGNVYVADTDNHIVRKISPAGVVTTLAGAPGAVGAADGAGAAARFSSPGGVAVDNSGNVYVADTSNHVIRKIAPTGVVSTFAGSAGVEGSDDGNRATARFYFPGGVAVDSTGNVFVADTYNSTVRKITSKGVVSTLAGKAGNVGSADGSGASAGFAHPVGIAIDNAGNVLVVDGNNHAVRKITPAGVVTTLAAPPAAPLKYPIGVAADRAGNIYVADSLNSAVRKISPEGVVSTLAGPRVAALKSPSGVAADGAGNVYITDTGDNTIRKIAPISSASP
jgi:sugar lactone lactonase YvrE